MSPRSPEGLSIGEVAERFGIPVSTLRYYDRQGLFPNLGRKGGQRRFSQSDIGTLRVVECLKASGLEIAQIRRFMEAVAEGPSTYPERLELFEARHAQVEEEMERLQDVLDVLAYKRWLYRGLVDGESEKAMHAVDPADMPEAVARGWCLLNEM